MHVSGATAKPTGPTSKRDQGQENKFVSLVSVYSLKNFNYIIVLNIHKQIYKQFYSNVM